MQTLPEETDLISIPDPIRMLSSGSIGTSFMTLFSHLVSESEQEQFREPELLATLIENLHANIKKEYAQSAGWVLHYLVGYMFAMIYQHVWKHTRTKPGFASGLVLGGISGVLAIAVWNTVFRLHPDPPRIDFKKYYIQLFIAHLVFGVTTAMGYPLKKNIPLFAKRS